MGCFGLPILEYLKMKPIWENKFDTIEEAELMIKKIEICQK